MVDKIQKIDPYNRPPRLQKSFRRIDIEIPSPPKEPDETARNLLMTLLPMSSFLVMGLFYALAFGRGTGLGWIYALPMLGIAVFTFIIAYITFGQQKYEQRQRWLKQQRDYHRTLDKKEARLLAGRELQAGILVQKFQKPHDLLRRVKNQEITIWERRREDPDFLGLRLGVGEAASIIDIKPPDPDLNSRDVRRAFNIYVEYRKIPNVPVIVDLKKIGSLALVGNRNTSMSLMRSLIVQIAALNSPDDLHLYMFSSKPYYQTWKWLRWLPHTSENHIGGHPSFMAFDVKKSKDLLSTIAHLLDKAQQNNETSKVTSAPLAHPILLLFDNDIGVRDELIFAEHVMNSERSGIYSIFLCERLEDVPSSCGSVVEVNDAGFKFSATGVEGLTLRGIPDTIALIDADNFSHRLLPLAVQTIGRNTRIPSRVNFLQLYHVDRIEQLGVENRWSNIPDKDGVLPFKIRIGSETYSDPLVVNLSENNDGPHGLIAGTTGSGKSELLQTLVGSLALMHHPYLLNFMLIDFKGGSTFGVFEKIPHVVGLVSNLDKLSANRALEALNTELVYRENFLKDHNAKDIIAYHQDLVEDEKILDPLTQPLPHLFVIVDEFAQMASEMPAFLNRLKEIARLGRSLGIHLILATQRPAGVVTDDMRANLNFRISLRVQNIDDSRDMLRRPDAAYLPADLPGRAYFQIGDGGTLRQFQVARAGTDYHAIADKDKKYDLFSVSYEDNILVTDHDIQENGQTLKKDAEDTTIAKALAYEFNKVYNGMPHKILEQILLPPLGFKIDTKKEVFSFDEKNSWIIWWAKDWNDKWDKDRSNIQKVKDAEQNQKEESLAFRVPVGILDSLKTHSQPPHFINFLEHGGHVILVGGPQSGKTYFLQTLCYSLACHYNPAQVNIYALSFAGRELDILAGLPHVGSIIDGSETEKMRRLIRHLQKEIEDRKRAFFEENVKDLTDYNTKVDLSRQIPYICMLIDNFGELRNLDYDDELAEIERLVKTGRIYGLHFVLTALQSNDVSKLSNIIQHRIAFNITDHNEYLLLVGRPESMDFDALPKGRCFVNIANPPMQCQIGMPLLQKKGNEESENWDSLISEMTLAWGNKKKPSKIENLSQNEFISELFEKSLVITSKMASVVGVNDEDLLPSILDWKSETPHYLVGGPSQSGRTSLLHTFVLGLAHADAL